MVTYTDRTLDRTPPTLDAGEREHVLVMQDESIFHTNKYRRRSWLAQDQQPIQKKGYGQVVHVSDFISETIGRLKLSDSQIADQLKLPEEQRLPTFEARKIIYPGKASMRGGISPSWSIRSGSRLRSLTTCILITLPSLHSIGPLHTKGSLRMPLMLTI